MAKEKVAAKKHGLWNLLASCLPALITAGGLILAHRHMTPVHESPQRVFGQWEQVPIEIAQVPRQAKTDGFVVVFTHEQGKKVDPASVIVLVGPERESLAAWTRANPYNGTMCPVAKDQWWKIENRRAGGGVTVRWISIRNTEEQQAEAERLARSR